LSNGFIQNTAQSLRVEKYVWSSGEFFRQPRLDTQSFRPPLADPSAPSVQSKRNESSSRHEFVNLRLPWGCLHAGTKIIVDHKPTTVGQQIAIAIQVSAHISIRIENEEAHLTAGQHLPKSVSTSGSCGSEKRFCAAEPKRNAATPK